jgi:hypothetical protein
MGGIKDFLSGNSVKGALEGILGNADKIIDNVVTNEEERGKVKNEFGKLLTEFVTKTEQHITDRHKADMASDSWLSKNIRPMTLIFVLALYSIFSVLDGNVGEFNISDAYVSLLGQWGMLIMSFYFGGRTVEKIGGMVSGFKTKK